MFGKTDGNNLPIIEITGFKFLFLVMHNCLSCSEALGAICICSTQNYTREEILGEGEIQLGRDLLSALDCVVFYSVPGIVLVWRWYS